MSNGENEPPVPAVAVTELRALEWDVTEIIRRLEIVQQQLQRLQQADHHQEYETDEPGSL